jgi:hypothetical protein
MKCLRLTDVTVELGRFKPKTVFCRQCRSNFTSHEEKETDVAIATKLMELGHVGTSGVVVLITGDTDLAPAVKTATRLFAQMEVFFAFPYRRSNAELQRLKPRSFKITVRSYLTCQFPDPLDVSGHSIPKPASW